MKTPDSSDKEKIKQFIYGELSDEEAEVIEERMFSDTDFFYQITSLEDELVDWYVAEKLKDEELSRFESGLAKSPELQEQVEFAGVLKSKIAEQKELEKSPEVVPAAAAQTSIWKRAADLFNFKSPAVQYAMAGLIILLGAGVVWLLFDGYRVREELARAQNERIQRELQISQLNDNISETKQQIINLQEKLNQADNKDFIRLIDEKKAELEQYEKRLEAKLKQRNNNSAESETAPPSGILIAAITPIGGRGSTPEIAPKEVKITDRTVTFQLPLQTETDFEYYEAEVPGFKSEVIRAGLCKRQICPVKLPVKGNLIFTVWGVNEEIGERKKIGEYQLKLEKKE